MVCHVPHVSQIKTKGGIVAQTFLRLFKETSLILFTSALGNEGWSIWKKRSPVNPKIVTGKKKRKQENEKKGSCKGFSITRKCKKKTTRKTIAKFFVLKGNAIKDNTSSFSIQIFVTLTFYYSVLYFLQIQKQLMFSLLAKRRTKQK